jgi:hypothetical protein
MSFFHVGELLRAALKQMRRVLVPDFPDKRLLVYHTLLQSHRIAPDDDAAAFFDQTRAVPLRAPKLRSLVRLRVDPFFGVTFSTDTRCETVRYSSRSSLFSQSCSHRSSTPDYTESRPSVSTSCAGDDARTALRPAVARRCGLVRVQFWLGRASDPRTTQSVSRDPQWSQRQRIVDRLADLLAVTMGEPSNAKSEVYAAYTSHWTIPAAVSISPTLRH